MIPYLVAALLVAVATAWSLTAVASDEGPLRLRERVAYALLGACAGVAWPLLIIAALAVWLAGVAAEPSEGRAH